jgi:hypothetical protein
MHPISWQKVDLDDDKECSPAVDINAASNWRSFGMSRCGSQRIYTDLRCAQKGVGGRLWPKPPVRRSAA